MSFFDYALSQMIEPDNLLVKIESIVNWEELSDLLDKKLIVREGKVAGKVPYNYLSLFKVLLIQQWHSLSDPKMESSLKTRIDFMWFTGFGLAGNDFVVPDETTICRFRNKLVKRKLLDKLLKKVNNQLESHNLKVKISNGAILDATLIEAAVNSQAKPKVIVEDRKENDNNDENDSNNGSNNKILSANEQTDAELDKDAKWLKKGKTSIFGYKGFITTDASDGYIEAVHVTPANVSEITELENALSNVDTTKGIKVLFADKGYASNDNVELLKKNNIGNGIMDKAARNKALTVKQTRRNRRISKTRYIVERTNATLKNIFKFERAKYLGLAKVKAQTLLVSIAHNLLKAANKIQVSEMFYRKVVSKNCLNGLFA